MADLKPVDQMTNDEFYEFVVNHMLDGWIPLRMYLRLFPTESQAAVNTRLSRKTWQRGVHYNVPEGGNAWVNLKAIKAWASGDEAVVPSL